MSTIINAEQLESQDASIKLKVMPWLICLLAAVFYGYEYLLRISPSVMTSQLMRVFHVNAATLGELSAFFYFAYTPMQLPVGLLMDRFGPRRLLTFAGLVCGAGVYIFALTRSLYVAEFGRFLVGFGSAFAFIGVLKLATIWFPPERFATVSGIASALGIVGAIAGDVFLSRMTIKYGWASTLKISAIAAVILTLFIFLIIRDHGDGASSPHDSETASLKSVLSGLKTILKHPLIWMNGLFGCLVYLPTTAFAELWGIQYLENAKYLTQQHAAWAVSVLFLGWGIGAPIAGWMSDRIGRRTLPMTIGAILSCVFFCILLYVPHLSINAVFVTLFCLGASYSVQVIIFAYACEISPRQSLGSALAVTNMIVMFGGMLFQPLIGYFLDSAGHHQHTTNPAVFSPHDFTHALAVIPIMLLVAAVIPCFMKETHCQPMLPSVKSEIA